MAASRSWHATAEAVTQPLVVLVAGCWYVHSGPQRLGAAWRVGGWYPNRSGAWT
jgi:hypothetical protein